MEGKAQALATPAAEYAYLSAIMSAHISSSFPFLTPTYEPSQSSIHYVHGPFKPIGDAAYPMNNIELPIGDAAYPMYIL